MIGSTIIITMSTTVCKFSISMPDYIYQQMVQLLDKRELSRFISEAVEEKILDETVRNTVEDFIALRSRLPKVGEGIIQEAIGKGRI